jgi:uncharacterized cupredoxin-like copper-binding protein
VAETPRATIRVRAGEFKFEPSALRMRPGAPTRIELANEGLTDHALIVAAPARRSGDWIQLHALARESDAGTFSIDRAGTYTVLCTIPGHSEAGMVGELVVR